VSILKGRRILIVEDEFFVAVTASDMLEELGAIVVGPAANVAQALMLAGSECIDAALLDINLCGQSSEPVAAKLDELGVPVVFATGYGKGDGDDIAGRYVLGKPYTQDKLHAELIRALEGKTAREPVADV